MRHWRGQSSAKCVVVGLSFMAAACGKPGDQHQNGSAQATASEGPVDPLAAANRAVPAAWKSKLTFAMTDVSMDHGPTVSVPVPISWKGRGQTWAAGHFQPPSDQSSSDGWGARSDMYIGFNCDGGCSPKTAAEWSKSADRTVSMVFDPRLSPNTIKDDKVEGRRAVVASMHGSTTMLTVWWKDGGDRYYECSVVMPDGLKDLIPAFEQACLGARPQ